MHCRLEEVAAYFWGAAEESGLDGGYGSETVH